MGATAPKHGFWMRRVVAGISATAEACFPPNDVGAPDWQATRLVERTVEYIQMLPPNKQRELKALFLFWELSPLLLMFGFRRLSKHRPEKRLAYVSKWRSSSIFLRVLLADALKAVLTMGYLSHPAALAYIGHSKACAHPEDPLQMRVRPDAFAGCE